MMLLQEQFMAGQFGTISFHIIYQYFWDKGEEPIFISQSIYGNI